MVTDWIKKNSESALLFFILLVGACLRFYHLGFTSFSNDELSALTRARFDGFGQLVEKGIKTDGHPAFAQTLIWSTIHLLNDNVFVIRFLFAMAGIAAIYFIYLLGKEWFGKWCGLLSAAALSVIQFSLLYSQIARPYSFALLFSIMAAYYWTKILFEDKVTKQHRIGYVLCMSLCMYTHYFSFMLAGIMGLTGLFFMRKTTFRNYLLMNILVVLLFIPHIKIFLAQLAFGGIGFWLPKPQTSFFLSFVYYCFNESQIVLILFLFILVMSFIFSMVNRPFNKFHIVAFLWLLLPFIIGYSYSILVDPVLQNSTLIVSLPFLLLFFFSFVNEKSFSKPILITLVAGVFLITSFSTVAEKKYYTTNHFGVFKEIAEKSQEWSRKYGEDNITKVYSLVNPDYLGYYFNKLNYHPQHSFFTDTEFENYGKIRQRVDSSTDYFLYAWTNVWHYYETYELIAEKYPLVAERDTFFNSEIALFRKSDVKDSNENVVTETDMENGKWEKEKEKRTDSLAHSGKYSQNMYQQEYSIASTKNIGNLKWDEKDILKAEVWFYAPDSVNDAVLVASFDKDGLNQGWTGMGLRYFHVQKNKWQKVFLCAKLPQEKNCTFSVYVWNPSKKKFFIDDFKVVIKKKIPLFREL